MTASIFATSFALLSRVLRKPGAATVFSVLLASNCLLIFPTKCISKDLSGPVYPLKVSKNGRYLVDQNSAPFLIMGDAPHAMFGNLSEAQAEQYLSDRASRGFNSVWIEILCNSYCGCRSDGSTRDGIPPFLKAGDVSTPNPDYFRKVDDIVKLAAQRGMVVFLDSFDTGGWLSVLRSNGRSKDYGFGSYLGGRYKNVPNIIWITGNDFQTWQSNPTDNSDVEAIMKGIASADPNHLQTTELNFNESGSLDDDLLSPYTNLVAAYSYYPTYREVYAQYNAALGRKPVFMEEGYYEGGTYGALDPKIATNLMLRKQAYWTILAGGSGGYLYGSKYFDLHAGWQQGIDTPGATQLGHWKAFFSSIPWYNLSPDQSHRFVVSGYGTPSRIPNFIQRHVLRMKYGNVQTDGYATAGYTPSGEVGVVYLPERATITVDMSIFHTHVEARWFDPAAGKYRDVDGSPFPNVGMKQFASPGNNSDGDPDWVLLLRANRK
jgi:hypothetical protein